MPAAVQRERTHPGRMAGGEMHAHGGAERHTRHVGALDAEDAEERGDLVGIAIGRVRPGRLVALTRAQEVDRDAAEVLGVGRKLERVAGVVRRRVRDQQERLTLALDVVVDRQPVDLDLWHALHLLTTGRTPRHPAWRG
jgi:hypothetical protein